MLSIKDTVRAKRTPLNTGKIDVGMLIGCRLIMFRPMSFSWHKINDVRGSKSIGAYPTDFVFLPCAS